MFIPLMMLTIESSGVVALRMIDAAFEATSNLMAGASSDEIVHRYRQHVAVNARRLGNRQ
jgi:hypothetical protein